MANVNDRERINNIALQYAEYLKKEYKLRGIFIYGSYAKGNYSEDSDIDIAVIAEDFTGDKVEDIFRLMKLRRKVDYRIEPHPFDYHTFNENNPEAREIIKNGIKII